MPQAALPRITVKRAMHRRHGMRTAAFPFSVMVHIRRLFYLNCRNRVYARHKGIQYNCFSNQFAGVDACVVFPGEKNSLKHS